MGFRFKTGRTASARQDDLTGLTTEPTTAATEEPGIINGQKARSLLEWWAAKALWKMQRKFIYQYPISGGTSRRGGFVIDFLLIDGPTIIIEMQGERWHTGQFGSNEKMREAQLVRIFHTQPRYVWENECSTEYDTYQAVRKAIYG